VLRLKLFQVSATDADIGENAEIEYLVDDASAQWIQIADPRTGNVMSIQCH